jgi:2-beta-glucuronyltransferase
LNRALVLTGTFPDAKRRYAIHGLCEALLRRGWTLDFVTLGQSLISQFNPRNLWPHVAQRPVNQWIKLEPNLWSFVWKAPFHPLNLRHDLLNKIITPIHRLYPKLLPAEVRLRAETADLILFDSSYSTIFIGMMRALAPNAVLVYNASDRLRTHRAHPLVCQCEMKYSPLLDLVRVPAQVMIGDYPNGARAVYIPHGLDKASFSARSQNPFSTSKNAISIGDGLFDKWALDVLAMSYPDWKFHLFGVGSLPSVPRKNIIVHGEERFANLIPYIKYADVGLAPYRLSDSADYLSQSSMRMIQYTYCRLPILVPFFAASGRAHACGYEPGDASSLRKAFAKAIHYDRGTIDDVEVLSWDEVLEQVLEKAFAAWEERSTHKVQDCAPI